MNAIAAAVLSALVSAVVSASLKVKEEHRTAFFGEDIHLDALSGLAEDVVFKSRTNRSAEVVLLRDGVVGNPRAHLNSLGHLVLEDVQEEDEGVYVIRNNNTNTVKHLILIVRDCAVEQVIKYGDSYSIHLNQVEGPITLEYRPFLIQHTSPNKDLHATEAPPVLLYNRTTVSAEEYVGRLSVNERRVMLHSVRMSDEGSFTVYDRNDKVRRRNCLNVREHQSFLHLSHGETLKMKLYQPHSKVSVVFRPKSDNQDRTILNQGVLASPLDPMLEGRLNVEGSVIVLKKVHVADTGVFKVTDLAGFLVANIYIEVEAYKLPPLSVAVLSMLGLIAFMLLICLLSCVYKVHKRNEKSKKLMLIAQQAGKVEGEGEAFRQVVHEAYTRFTEESLMQSVSERPTESTEVTIKGLEVSKPGRYQALTSDNNFLEMSDSGVEFTSSGLPLDSDTEAVMTYASHKPLLDAASPLAAGPVAAQPDSPDATIMPDGDLSAARTPDSAMSASPASNPRSLADGSLGGASTGATAAASDSATTAEGGDGVQKEEGEESAPST